MAENITPITRQSLTQVSAPSIQIGFSPGGDVVESISIILFGRDDGSGNFVRSDKVETIIDARGLSAAEIAVFVAVRNRHIQDAIGQV